MTWQRFITICMGGRFLTAECSSVAQKKVQFSVQGCEARVIESQARIKVQFF